MTWRVRSASVLRKRPFAEQARKLCPESDTHHAQVWFCEMCYLIERRLTPLALDGHFQAIVRDEGITLRVGAYIV